MRGVISKDVSKTRGFVFITGDDDKEYFLHRDSFKDSWGYVKGGLAVEFTTIQGTKGLRAEDCVFAKD